MLVKIELELTEKDAQRLDRLVSRVNRSLRKPEITRPVTKASLAELLMLLSLSDWETIYKPDDI